MKDILKEFLDKYPQFYYREPEGNHHKYSSVLAEAFREKRSADKLVGLFQDVNRPIRIWREQEQEYLYNLRYDVNLDDIRRVRFYRDEYISQNLLGSTDLYLNVATGSDHLGDTTGANAYNGASIESSNEWSDEGERSFKVTFPGLLDNEAVHLLPNVGNQLLVQEGDERTISMRVKGHDSQYNYVPLNVATGTDTLSNITHFFKYGEDTIIESTIEEKFTGNRSIKATIPGVTTSEGIITSSFSVEPDSIYSCMVAVKAPIGFSGRLYVHERDSDEVIVKNNWIVFTGTGNWQIVEFNDITFTTGTKARIYVSPNIAYGSSISIYADAFAFVKDTRIYGVPNPVTGLVESKIDLRLTGRNDNGVLSKDSSVKALILSSVPQTVTLSRKFSKEETTRFNIQFFNSYKAHTDFYFDRVMINDGLEPLPYDYVNYTKKLLHDSGELPEGTDHYQGGYDTTDPINIIPNLRFYLEVDTWDEDFYTKGFPENNTPQGDKYDHDQGLDILGNYYGVPRRIHKTNLTPYQYPYTYPQYCIDETEWDYTYENRIKQCMIDYREMKLVEAEIKKHFNIIPQVEGRWRHICRQNISNMAPEEEAQYMATKEWNSGVFDITSDLKHVPPNLNPPDVDVMQGIVNKAFPLGKKAYYHISGRYPTASDPPLEDTLSFDDSDGILFRYQVPPDLLGLDDNVAFNFPDNINIREDLANFHDTVNFKLPGGFTDTTLITDNIGRRIYTPTLYHDTHTDFSNDILTGCSVTGTGTGAYIKLDPVNTNQNKSPTGQSQSGDGFPWANPGNVVDSDLLTYGESKKPAPVKGNTGYKPSDTQINVNDWPYSSRRWGHSGPAMSAVEVNDGTACYADVPSASRTSDILRVTNFKFNVPSDATIKGVTVRVKRRQSGSGPIAYDNLVKLVYNGNERGDNRASTDVWPQSFATKTYGGSSTNWNANLTPAMVNSSTFGVDIQFYNASSYSLSAFIDYIDIKIDYTIPSELNTPKILNLTGLSYSIPSDTTVVGLVAAVKSYCETENGVVTVNVTAGGVSKTRDLTPPTSAAYVYAGGENDLWNGLPTTPSSYNNVTMSLDVTTQFLLRIYHIILYVYYKRLDGTVETATITVPTGSLGWDKIESNETTPTNSSIKWDVINPTNDTILLSNKTTPIDISSLTGNLKLKAKLATTNINNIPRIDWFRVKYEKNY